MTMTSTRQIQQRIEDILPQLQPAQLELVLAFSEFVRTRNVRQTEDALLWSFVEREQAYRAAHPEDVATYTSDEELLAALDAES
jgi:hypothetical protein